MTDALLAELAAAESVALGTTYQQAAALRPPPEVVLRWYFRATPAGRVLLALLLDGERGRYALATLALDPRVADVVRPMLANDPSYGAAPAPCPAGADAVLAPRFAAALRALLVAAGRAAPDVDADAGLPPGTVGGWLRGESLPAAGETERVEAALRPYAVFAPGLLDLAGRRAIVVTPEGGPAPGDLDVLCAEVQRVLDAATLADVPVSPAPGALGGRRGVRAAAAFVADVPEAPFAERLDTHDPYARYQCTEHGDYVLLP